MLTSNGKTVRLLRSNTSLDLTKSSDKTLTANAFQKMLSLALEKQKTDIQFAFSKDLQAKFDSLNAELKQLKNKNEILKSIITSPPSNILYLERMDRKCNLIINGLSDSSDAATD